jgi:hypothetical protein
MKKLQLIISLLLLIKLFSYGQTHKNSTQLNVSIGPAFPIGQFANGDIYKKKAGFASTGAILNVSCLAPTKKRIGFVASFYGQINPVSRKNLERSFANFQFGSVVAWNGSGTPPTPQGTTYPNWKFRASSWEIGSLMAGGYAESKIKSEKVKLISKASLGFIYAMSPKIEGSSITDTATAYFAQSSESGFGFSFLIEELLRFKVNNKINFLVGAEYLGTHKIKFKDVVTKTYTVKYPNDPGRMVVTQGIFTSDSRQKISSINIIVGICLKL